MNRRTFATSIPFAVAAAGATAAAAQAVSGAPEAKGSSMTLGPAPAGARPFTIGMLAFPDMTNLDFAGPYDFLARAPNVKIHVISKAVGRIVADSGTSAYADTLYADAPELDMLFVPGGPGMIALMDDPMVLGFLRDRAPRAKWITSVCTGSLVLGAAGLLRGYKAATHWTTMDILPTLGAIPVHQRVVIDRNRITGGGVTAGIDFGLTVLDRVWGRGIAETIQLANEYDPSPPFNAGSPQRASKESVAAVMAMTRDGRAGMAGAAARRAREFA